MGEFNEILRKYFNSSSLSKKDLADSVGVTRGYITTLINDPKQTPPQYDLCSKIADALGLNLDERVELYKAAFGERTSSENGYKEELRKYKQKMQDKVDLW